MNDASTPLDRILAPARNQHDRLFRQPEAAEFLNVSEGTLENWRWNGRGPIFVRISKRSIRYLESDLLKWIKARRVHSTSEESQAEAA